MVDALLQKEIDEKVTPESVSEADVQRYYAEHAAAYRQPEAVRVSQVLTKDRTVADRVAAKAKVKGKGPVFPDLVAKYSEDEDSKKRGGDVGFLEAGNSVYPPRMIEAAFRLLEPGDVSPVVETEKGFHVLVLTERRAMATRPLREVDAEVRRAVATEQRARRRDELAASVRARIKVQVFPEKLSGPGPRPASASR
jgi:parvulin-like peptidyl-prolyl isomerase